MGRKMEFLSFFFFFKAMGAERIKELGKRNQGKE